jgi:CoA:oxalate CoA-transferase
MIWELNNRDLGTYKASGHPIRFSKTPVEPGAGAPVLGENTETILQEIGYGDQDIARLKAAGIIK